MNEELEVFPRTINKENPHTVIRMEIDNVKFVVTIFFDVKSEILNNSPMLLHQHGEFEIFFVDDELYIYTLDETFHFSANTVVVVPPDLLHYANESFKGRAFIFSVEKKHFSQGKEDYFDKFQKLFLSKPIFAFEKSVEYDWLLKELYEAIRLQRFGDEERCKATLTLLFLKLLQAQISSESYKRDLGFSGDTYVYKISDCIVKHFNEHLTIADVAKEIFLSERQVSRLIKKYFHTTFPRLLSDRRLSIAAAMLCSTDYSVSKICEMVGFETESSFFTTFKKRYNKTPLQYRKAYQRNKS